MNLGEAADKMEDAHGEVATTAMQVADLAQQITHRGEEGYFVPAEEMKLLKEQIKEWKAACADFHLAMRKVGL